MSEDKEAGMWAIVEIFGHQRIAGFLSENVIAGQGFVRIDVPEVPAPEGSSEGPVSAHTKLYGPGAIYAINPVDEAVAKEAARQIRHVPVHTYGLRDVIRNLGEDERHQLLAAPGANR